jgi:hypothetical protein
MTFSSFVTCVFSDIGLTFLTSPLKENRIKCLSILMKIRWYYEISEEKRIIICRG